MRRGVDEFIRSPYVRTNEADLTIRNTDSQESSAKGNALLIFSLGESLFGIPSASIQEVCEGLPIEKLPFISNRLCSGFVSLRGITAPLLNLRAYLKMDDISDDVRSRIIVLSHDRLVTAISVDRTHGVMACIAHDGSFAGTPGLPTARIVSNGKTVTVLDPITLSSSVEEGLV